MRTADGPLDRLTHSVMVVAFLCALTSQWAAAGIMPPALDDRSYRELKSEVLARIPKYAPEWTNTEPGDPGRTLLELFAFVAETLNVDVQADLGDLLWIDYDPDDEKSQGSLAYVLADAAYTVRFGKDAEGDDWLIQNGIDPRWTYAELRAAALRIPEPATSSLLGLGLVALGFAGRRRRRTGT